VLENEIPMILSEAHEGIAGGHYAGRDTMQMIFCIGIWWSTLHKDAKEYFHAFPLEGMICLYIHRLHCSHLINGQ
jgi:hypothetical protein